MKDKTQTVNDLLLNSRFRCARSDFDQIKETLDEAKKVGEKIRE